MISRRGVTSIALTVVLVVSAGASVAGVAVAANDAYESNDQLSTATSVSPGTHSDLQLVGEEDDYFAVQLEEGETLDLTVTYSQDAPMQLGARLLDPSGDLIEYGVVETSSFTNEERVRIGYEADSTGTYYVQVFGDTGVGSSDTVDYELSFAVAANDANEPNGLLTQATPVSPGTPTSATVFDQESDYYKLTLEEGETLNLTVAYSQDAPMELGARLLDPSGDVIEYGVVETSSFTNEERVRIGYEADSTDTYYVRVFGDTGVGQAEAVDYDLSFAVAANDANEPNGLFTQATPVSPGSSTSATVFDQESDYYELTLEEGETLNLTVAYSQDASMELGANLFDSSGDRIEYGQVETSSFSNEERVRIGYEADSADTYYVRVYGDSGVGQAEAVDYDLSFEVAANDPNEPNGLFTQATPVSPGTPTNATVFDQESDYYELTLEEGETLNLTVAYSQDAPMELGANLFDSSGDLVRYGRLEASSFSNEERVRISYEADSTETYYVRVFGDTGVGQAEAADYDLSFEVAANDPNEPNGEITQATPLGPGTYSNATMLGLETDYYSVSLSENERLNLTVTHSQDAPMTLGATLLNPSGEVIAHHEQQTPKFTNAVELRIAHQATQPGTYYVRVFGDTGADPVETVNYDLSVTGGSYPDATPPTARIAANATEVNVSEPVSFDASASTDDVGVDAISWDLDDDGAFDDATGETATTSFETPGEHSVSVRVTDRGGNADTATATVTVAAPADATSVEVAIAGSDGQLSLTELQRAIQYWATSEPVPGTDGGTLTIMELQSLIQTWASGGSIAAAG